MNQNHVPERANILSTYIGYINISSKILKKKLKEKTKEIHEKNMLSKFVVFLYRTKPSID